MTERSATQRYVDQVQAGVDFVESHLGERFALRDVSVAAAMSHWHFQRIFKAVTGETLMTYVRSRRMALALDRLLRTDDRIIEIAVDAGFDSHEAFTRAFNQQFGMTPDRYRRIGDASLFLRKAAIDADYLRHLRASTPLEPTLASRPPMMLVGLRSEIYGVDSERNNLGAALPALWDEFLARIEEIGSRIEPLCYGVVRPARHDDELLVYHAATEVRRSGAVPDGMTTVEVPGACYAHFTHRGPAADVDHTVNYAYSTWLLRSGLRHTYGPDLEIYGPEYHATEPTSVFRYAIPVA